jgi:hypothetical protein
VTDCPVDALTQAAERGASREEIESVTVDYPACGDCGDPTMPYSDLLITMALPHATGEQRDRARLCEKCRERATALVMKEAMGVSYGVQGRSHAR